MPWSPTKVAGVGGWREELLTQNTDKSDPFFNICMVLINQEENPNSPKGKPEKQLRAHLKRKYDASKQ